MGRWLPTALMKSGVSTKRLFDAESGFVHPTGKLDPLIALRGSMPFDAFPSG